MLLKQEQVNPCEVDLEIQADVEKVKKAINEVYKEYGKYTAVPGFRKGKAPRHLLEKVVDKERVRQFVIDKILDDLYKEAIDEAGLKPFAVGSVDVTQFDVDDPELPFLATARVPLSPQVELGEYTGLEVKKTIHKTTEEEIDSEINEMLKRSIAPTEVTDRPVKTGDNLLVAFGEVNADDDEEAEDQRPLRMLVVGDNLPEIDEGVVGMNLDETRDITVTYPEDYDNEELRGTSKTFKITVKKIREQVLPEITDEWVAEFSKSQEHDHDHDHDHDHEHDHEDAIDTVEKLRNRIRENLQAMSDQMSDNTVDNQLVDLVVSGSKVDYPQVMLEAGMQDRFNELNERLKKNKVTLQQYLAYNNQTPEDYYEQIKEQEAKSLMTGLVLREVVDKEKLEVSDEDVEQEIQNMAETRHVPVETIRAYVENKNVVSEIKNRILQKKLLEFLKSSSNIVVEEN